MPNLRMFRRNGKYAPRTPEGAQTDDIGSTHDRTALAEAAAERMRGKTKQPLIAVQTRRDSARFGASACGDRPCNAMRRKRFSLALQEPRIMRKASRDLRTHRFDGRSGATGKKKPSIRKLRHGVFEKSTCKGRGAKRLASRCARFYIRGYSWIFRPRRFEFMLRDRRIAAGFAC